MTSQFKSGQTAIFTLHKRTQLHSAMFLRALCPVEFTSCGNEQGLRRRAFVTLPIWARLSRAGRLRNKEPSTMKVLVVLAIVGFGTGALGLKCWTCNNAITNEECNIMGQVQTCKANEACVNMETTSGDGSKYEITKGCKAKNTKACRLADPQNVGSYPTNCQYNSKGSVCRCCCNTDLCNGPQTECKDAITCRKPDRPGNGRVKCPSSISYGTKCTISCLRGYVRSGPRAITCTNGTDQGYWSPKETTACLAKTSRPIPTRIETCAKEMTAPEHGSVVCENKGKNDEETRNYVGMSCAFKCEAGYFLSGAETMRCLPGGRWSAKAPECKKGRCQRPTQDKNRIDQCSDGSHFGSVCNVRCRDGFMPVGDSGSVTCQSVSDQVRQGKWSNRFPDCVRAVCRPQLIKPTNGKMTCTKKNLLGSLCTFECNEGYELTDLTLTKDGIIQCLNNGGVVQWDGVPPKCTKITCPRLEMPENGNVACSGDGSVGSKCDFKCNDAYDLVGSAESVITAECQNPGNGDGIGVWSIDTVNCVQVQCQPERTAPENGAVFCTNENLQGSVCTFTCDDSYDMDGTTARMVSSTCEYDPAGDGNGKWSVEPPTCSTRFYCPATQSDPDHGTVSCDDESYLGSTCQFACEDGYELKGVDRITCRDLKNDGDAKVEWSSPAASCVASMCPEQWYDSGGVNRNCDGEKEGNGYPVGTRCTYECSQPGYYLDEGEESVEISCIAKNTWSAAATPRCFIQTCPMLEMIKNGAQPECTNGNRYGSRCRYTCAAKHSPTHEDALVCESGDGKLGSWDRAPPRCVMNECPSVPLTPSKGAVVCSSGARVGSFCTLECDRGYAPKADRIDCIRTVQRLDGEMVEIPQFTFLDKFCCAKCLTEINLVLAVDARFQMGLQSAVDFAKTFLAKLAGQENPTTFSSFVFNAEVDTSSAIVRQAIAGEDKLSDVIERMDQWTISEEGQNSDTMAALDYASNTMFGSLDSSAVNFLIIVADDSPDNVGPAELSKIQNKGINIIVTARNNFAKIKWEKLLSDGDDVVNQDSNQIFNRIYDVAFKNSCSNMAEKCV